MKVMGIDSSSQKTGVAMYNGVLQYYDLLDFASVGDYDTRFGEMIRAIGDEIDKLKPDIVYVEDTWEKSGGFNNTATVKKLSYLVGAIRCLCLQRNIPFNLIYPSEWRRVVGLHTGKAKRNELKKMSVDYVAKQHGANVNDDVADAVCIAEAGYVINNELFE